MRGAMTCNIYGKQDEIRALIRQGAVYADPQALRGVIREERKAA